MSFLILKSNQGVEETLEKEYFLKSSGLIHSEILDWAMDSLEEGQVNLDVNFDTDFLSEIYGKEIESDFEKENYTDTTISNYIKDVERFIDKYSEVKEEEKLTIEEGLYENSIISYNQENDCYDYVSKGLSLRVVPNKEDVSPECTVVELVGGSSVMEIVFDEEMTCLNNDMFNETFEDRACEELGLSLGEDECWEIDGVKIEDDEVTNYLLDLHDDKMSMVKTTIEKLREVNPDFDFENNIKRKVELKSSKLKI